MGGWLVKLVKSEQHKKKSAKKEKQEKKSNKKRKTMKRKEVEVNKNEEELTSKVAKRLSRSKKKIDFISWCTNHRALETFLGEYLTRVDMAMLRMSSKDLNKLAIRTKREQEEHEARNNPDAPFSETEGTIERTLNMAIKEEKWKLALWLKNVGFKYYHPEEAEQAYIFRPYNKETKEQKSLLSCLIWKNKELPKTNYTQIAYWGDQTMKKRLFNFVYGKDGIRPSAIVDTLRNAIKGEQIALLGEMKNGKMVVNMDQIYDIAIRFRKSTVLTWALENVPLTLESSRAIYVHGYGEEAAYGLFKKQTKFAREFIEQNSLKVDHRKKVVEPDGIKFV